MKGGRFLLTSSTEEKQHLLPSNSDQGHEMKFSDTFDVKLNPLEAHEKSQNQIALGRMSIDKTYHGLLSATLGDHAGRP